MPAEEDNQQRYYEPTTTAMRAEALNHSNVQIAREWKNWVDSNANVARVSDTNGRWRSDVNTDATVGVEGFFALPKSAIRI